MKTVHEVSEISGVSVRALHHYDAIGLLKPTKVTEAGYRLYDEAALCRLQTILLFKELGFSLSDIALILDSPQFDRNAALAEHVAMLKLQRAHVDGLIAQAQKMMRGERADFAAFDNSNMEKYAEEVKAKWGKTDAYRESLEKTKNQTEADKKSMADGLMAQFVQFGALKDLSPASVQAQEAVKALQTYITDHFYTCTKEILACLGETYVADERFRANIDTAGGEGTAAFVAKAIQTYCK